MTKPEFQKELKEKVKEGVKPSHLKKLKRSKSEGDIPKAPPLPTQSTPLNRSKSTEPFTDTKYPYTTLISQQQELEKLRQETETKSTTISLLRKKIEDLEKSNTPLNSSELDNSLIARHQNLKDWFTQYSQKKKLDQELEENIDEAAQELLEQDKTISQLKGQVKKLELTNQSLTKDLDLATKLAQSRKVPYYSPDGNWDYLKYALYSLIALVFIYWFFKP